MDKFSDFISEQKNEQPYRLLNLIHDTPDDPNTTGDKALANTTIAWKTALTVPKLSRPKSSAHKEPVNGDEIPKLNP